VIIVCRRDDLPPRLINKHIDKIKLKHLRLPEEVVARAEMIIFLEGDDIRYLKNVPEIQSVNKLDVLFHYMTGYTVKPPDIPPDGSIRVYPPKKPHGNLRRRKAANNEASSS
jgi:hypothetical protein